MVSDLEVINQPSQSGCQGPTPSDGHHKRTNGGGKRRRTFVRVQRKPKRLLGWKVATRIPLPPNRTSTFRRSLPLHSYLIVCLTDLATSFAHPCLSLEAWSFISLEPPQGVSPRSRLHQTAFSPSESPSRQFLNELTNRREQLKATDLKISRSSTNKPQQWVDLKKNKVRKRHYIRSYRVPLPLNSYFCSQFGYSNSDSDTIEV